MNRRSFLAQATATVAMLAGAATLWRLARPVPAGAESFEVVKSDAQWHQVLNDAQYAVLRQESTERPGTSPLLEEHRKGVFHCAGCDLAAYPSETKYESGTGWPSFWDSLPGAIGIKEDTSLFMTRIEVHCHRCGGHFGHIFDDGPQPTGKRHCLNGVALIFKPATA